MTPECFGDDNPDHIPNSKDMPPGLGNDVVDPTDNHNGEAQFLPIDPEPELEPDRDLCLTMLRSTLELIIRVYTCLYHLHRHQTM